MLRLTLLITIIFLVITGFSQTIREAAFSPIYDSMGNITYIKLSDTSRINYKPGVKIYRYDFYLDTIGYYDCTKKRYVSMLGKKIKKR